MAITAAGSIKSDPPQDAPTEFWLDVLYYQKMFNTGHKVVMGHVTDMSHLSVHAEMQLEEMVLKWDQEAIFWMFDEIGSFTIQEEELRSQHEHEYVVQKASHPEFSTFEVLDLTEDEVAWGADSAEECEKWINQEKCSICGEWTNDFYPQDDELVCGVCHAEEE